MKNKISRKVVLMASGGLDSTVLAYWLVRKQIDVLPLFIDYGQHSHQTELDTLIDVLPKQISPNITVIRLPKVYEDSPSRLVKEPNLWQDRVTDADLHLPHRNLLLLATGSAFAESRGIHELYAAFIETHRASGADCCDTFFEMLINIFTYTGRVKLKLPFRRLSKSQVAHLGVKLRAPIERTFSCLAAARTPCGACPNCVDRLRAIENLT